MGLLVLILVAAVIWLYFKTKRLQERADKAARMAKQLENKRVITLQATSEQEPVSTQAVNTNNRRESPRAISASLNTGIPELDGPGMLLPIGEGISNQIFPRDQVEGYPITMLETVTSSKSLTKEKSIVK